MKFKLSKSSFEGSDMIIMLGVGAAIGGLMGFAGVIVGVVVVVCGWALTKLEKKEVEPNAE